MERLLGRMFVLVNNRIYARHFARQLRNLGLDPKEARPGEEEYVRKWSALASRPERLSYRLFSRYDVGETPDIVPEGIGRSYIEPVLNPVRYRTYYCDKNLYNQYLPAEFLPRAYARRINGGLLLDEDYNPIDGDPLQQIPAEVNALILKLSIDSDSGKGVSKLVRTANGWADTDGRRYDAAALMDYGDDWILQEAVEQHPFMSQFCSTAVNTLRIAVYRSVRDEQPHVMGCIMRIARDGAFVDNAHAGGMMVGVDYKTGRLNKYLTDQHGVKATVWNGYDFSDEELSVPGWERIVACAEEVSRRNHHLRFLALDVCIDANGGFKLLEYNCVGYSYWYFPFNGYKSLGEYTDEIIEYCSAQRAEQVKIQC